MAVWQSATNPAVIPRLRAAATWLLGLTAILLAGGCDIEKPVVPTFTTTLAVPIGEERLGVDELAAETDYLSIAADSCLAFTVTGDPDTLDLELDLQVRIDAESFAADLGNFELSVTEPDTFGFTLGELYPQAQLLDGMSVPVPAFAFEESSDPALIEDLQSATLSSGTIRLAVTNGLPIAISGSAPPELLTVTLFSETTGDSIATAAFPSEIPPLGQAVAVADLAGRTITSPVSLRIRGGSAGSTDPVTVHADDHLTVSAELTDLRASEAVAVIRPQAFDTDASIGWPDSLQVISASILSGILAYQLTNSLDVPCEAQLSWREISDERGQPLQSTVQLPAGAKQSGSIDFTGCSIAATDGEPLTELGVRVTTNTPGSSGAMVHIQAGDGVLAEIQTAELSFASVTGTITERTFAIDPVQQEVDLPDQLSGISLNAASLILGLENGTGMTGQLVADLTGTSAEGVAVTLPIATTIAPAVQSGPVETLVVLDEANSQVVDFLNNFPTRLALAGQVTIGGPHAVGTVRPHDRVSIAWSLEAPLAVAIENSIWTGKAEALGFDADTRSLIDKHAVTAEIVTEITNHLPLTAQLYLLAGTNPETLVSDPELILGPLTAASGLVDPQHQMVSAPTVSRPVITLDREQTRFFGQPDVHTSIEINLPGTEGQTVRIRASDFLSVRGVLKLELLVED